MRNSEIASLTVARLQVALSVIRNYYIDSPEYERLVQTRPPPDLINSITVKNCPVHVPDSFSNFISLVFSDNLIEFFIRLPKSGIDVYFVLEYHR